MPEITAVFQNSPSFNNPSFETEFIFLADISSVKLTRDRDFSGCSGRGFGSLNN